MIFRKSFVAQQSLERIFLGVSYLGSRLLLRIFQKPLEVPVSVYSNGHVLKYERVGL